MKTFNVGDEIEFINSTGGRVPDFETKSPYIQHGSCMFLENKGIVVAKYGEYYAVCYIDERRNKVILDFNPKYLELIKENNLSYQIY